MAEESSSAHEEASECENSPEVNHNVIRSSDSKENDFVPSTGAAKQLLDKWVHVLVRHYYV